MDLFSSHALFVMLLLCQWWWIVKSKECNYNVELMGLRNAALCTSNYVD